MTRNNYMLIGSAVLGAVVVLVASAVYFLTVTPAPLSAAKSFVALIETDEFEPAYSKYHADLKNQESFPEFVEVWSSRSVSLREANRSWSTDADEHTAVITGRFTVANDQSWSVAFNLVNQDDTWQIIDYDLRGGALNSGP